MGDVHAGIVPDGEAGTGLERGRDEGHNVHALAVVELPESRMPEAHGQRYGIVGNAFKDADLRHNLPGLAGQDDAVALVQAELFERGPVDGGDEHVFVQFIVGDELGVEGRDGGFGRAEAKISFNTFWGTTMSLT